MIEVFFKAKLAYFREDDFKQLFKVSILTAIASST